MAVMNYVNEVKHQRDLLVQILNAKGVTAAADEKFNTLIQKINNISSDSTGCGVDKLGIMRGEIEGIDVGSVMKITTPILTGIIPDMSGICECEVQ